MSTDTDDTLRKRLRERLSLQSGDDAGDGEDADGVDEAEQEADPDSTDTESSDDTEQEADGEHDEDEDDGMEEEAGMGDAVDMLVANSEFSEDEAQAFCESLAAAMTGGADDGEGAGDADGELAAEADIDGLEEDVAEATADVIEEELDELESRLDGVITEDDLSERLESFADTVGEETRNTIEQELTGKTPSPSSDGGSNFSKDDLLNNDPSEGGD